MIDYKWLDNLIEEISNAKIPLSDTLLKIKILAHKLKNDSLKIWINDEINGYSSNVPRYRNVMTPLMGNLVSVVQRRPNHIIDTTMISDADIELSLTHASLTQPLSELEHMVESNLDQRIVLSDGIARYLMMELPYDDIWHLDSVWQLLQVRNIKGVISATKNKLLDFLLGLTEEIITENNNSIMDNREKVDELIERTIGPFTADTINISIEDSSIKTINNGNNSTTNIVKEGNIHQINHSEYKNDIKDIIQLLKENIDSLNLADDDVADVKNEVQILETQIQRENPREERVNTALETIKSILTSITANLCTPKAELILSKIGNLLSAVPIG